MKNTFKKIAVMASMVVMMAASTISAQAAENRNDGTWKQNQTGWWYEFVDGSYLTNGWYWVDGNMNNVYECYYFDGNGYMAANTSIGSDMVDANGAWVVNGIVQTKRFDAVEQNNGKEEYTYFVSCENESNNEGNIPSYGMSAEDILNMVDWSSGYESTGASGNNHWSWH